MKRKKLDLRRQTISQLDPKRLPSVRGGQAEGDGDFWWPWPMPDTKTITCLSCPGGDY
jgi:hypothetical protein